VSSVVTLGYQPDGSASLVTTLGYGLFSNFIPPTPPDTTIAPYGPALSPADRRRWFGGDCESPISRACRRKTKEYLQRIEFGILPPEVKEEMIEKCVGKVTVTAEKVIESRTVRNLPPISSDRIINAVMKEMKSEIRQVLDNRRIMLEEQSEEEDIVVISSILLQ
jgi:hypothetical protein